MNETVYFIDGSTDLDGKIVSWKWDFGNEESATVHEPNNAAITTKYLTAASYRVTVTVQDNSGAKTSIEKELTVKEPSYIEAPCARNTYFVHLAPTESETAKVGDTVLIYRRRILIEKQEVIAVRVAKGTIVQLEEEGGGATVKIDTSIEHLPVMVMDLVKLDR